MKYDDKTQKRFGLTDSEIDTVNNNKKSPWHEDYKKREEKKKETKK